MSIVDSSSSVEIKVLFFARARELAGVSSATVKVASGTSAIDAYLDTVLNLYPALEPLARHCALAVNLEYISGIGGDSSDAERPPSKILAQGDELAVIPPISGG